MFNAEKHTCNPAYWKKKKRQFCYAVVFCLEHEAVRHEKDVPLTKPGKHSCILFCVFVLKMLFKEIVKYNCIWQMSKPLSSDLFGCTEWPWHAVPQTK